LEYLPQLCTQAHLGFKAFFTFTFFHSLLGFIQMPDITTLCQWLDQPASQVQTSISHNADKTIDQFHVHTEHDTFTHRLHHCREYAFKDSCQFKRSFFELDKVTQEFTIVQLGTLSSFTVTTITVHFKDGSFVEHCFW
jgi:hypothetical protein